jgi:hypothetical protein
MESKAKTSHSILEHINLALKDKIVHWNDPDLGSQCGVVTCINEKGQVIVNQARLPESFNIPKDLKPWQYIKIVAIDKCMMGVYEPVSLN